MWTFLRRHRTCTTKYNRLGMSVDIRKSGYRICGPISGYEKSQTISENNKWMASRRWLCRRRWRKMRVDIVIVDTLAQLPAAAATVCGAECPVIEWGGGSMQAASCKVSLSCSEWLSTLLLLLRHRLPAGRYIQTTHWANTSAHFC